MELKVNMEKHRRFLIDTLDPDHGLLHELKLSNEERYEIKYNQNPIKRSEKILECILEKNSYTEFIEALNNSKQTHVANFILEYKIEYGGDWPLTDLEIRTIDSEHKQLIDFIETEYGLIDSLFSNKVINLRQKESINAIAIRHQKVEVLLEMLRRCSSNDYRLTIECLHETNQSHAARVLAQGRDEVVDEILKKIETNLHEVEACIAEGDSRSNKVEDRKKSLLKMIENTERTIKERATELIASVDEQMKSLLKNLSDLKEEQLKELDNEKHKIDEVLASFKNLTTQCTDLKSRKATDDIYQFAQDTNTRADNLVKFQMSLLQRQIPTATVSLRFSNAGEFDKIVGRIEVQSESPPVKEKKSIVIGLNDGRNVTNEIIEFNLNRPNDISYLPPIPTTIHWGSVALTYDDKLFAIGIGKTCNEVWKFERNFGWKKCANLNQSRQAHCANIVDTLLYICGGSYSKKFLNSVEALDFLTNKSSIVGELVQAVESSACAAYKGLIYVFGGLLEGNIRTDCVQIYDTRDNRCSLFSKPMPFSQAALREFPWNNSVILLNHRTCFIFDFETENWREREQFKTGVYHFGLVNDDENVFVFGGGTPQEQDAAGNWLWKCTDEVKGIRLIDIINGNMVEWKKLGRLPKPALIHAYT